MSEAELPVGVSESRRLWQEKVRPKLAGRVSNSVMLLLGRTYNDGSLDKPIEEVTDAEFLSLPGFGPRTLAKIRRVVTNQGGEQEGL